MEKINRIKNLREFIIDDKEFQKYMNSEIFNNDIKRIHKLNNYFNKHQFKASYYDDVSNQLIYRFSKIDDMELSMKYYIQNIDDIDNELKHPFLKEYKKNNIEMKYFHYIFMKSYRNSELREALRYDMDSFLYEKYFQEKYDELMNKYGFNGILNEMKNDGHIDINEYELAIENKEYPESFNEYMDLWIENIHDGESYYGANPYREMLNDMIDEMIESFKESLKSYDEQLIEYIMFSTLSSYQYMDVNDIDSSLTFYENIKVSLIFNEINNFHVDFYDENDIDDETYETLKEMNYESFYLYIKLNGGF